MTLSKLEVNSQAIPLDSRFLQRRRFAMPSRIRSLAPDHLVFEHSACKADVDSRAVRHGSEIHLRNRLETLKTILTGRDERSRIIAKLVAHGPQGVEHHDHS
jgi:hypothetical protein